MLFLSALLSMSRVAEAACVLSGARPTVALPTMAAGQDFSFVASADCETLRFTIRGTTVSENPKSGGPVGPGPHTYKVHLTESEWNSVVTESGSTLSWVVTGRTSASAITRMVTTNDLKVDGGVTMSLSMADAKLVGAEAYDDAGYSVSGAGDVDGDGRDDLLVGDPEEGAYLVLGPVTGTLDLSMADAKLVQEARADLAGASVSGAGDVNGDGHDDLLIGARGNDAGGSDAGAAYMVLGPVSGTFDLSLADAKLVGEASKDEAGRSVSDAGDVDGDGHDDFLVAAPFNDEGALDAGAAYLVLGPVSGTLGLTLADATLVGENSDDTAGWASSGAGDVDGDGDDDVLVGAVGNDEAERGAGAAYLVLGPVSGNLDLALADAKLMGENVRGVGVDVTDAGDVDADGHGDLLVSGFPTDDGDENAAGAAWLVLGPVTGTLDLSFADAKLVGEHEFDEACWVSGAGDVDGNGHDDLLVGAADFGEQTGAAYLVLGPVTGVVDLSLADVKLTGEEEGDAAGWSVSGAGDVDADGHDDVLIGAYSNGIGGAAYLIYGGGL